MPSDILDMVHFAPAHTDSDIYVHFQNADVLHLGDTYFSAFFPFIDENSGGTITGMIRANEKALALAGNDTKIIPGHGPLATRTQLQTCHDMLSAIHEKIARLKATGTSEQEVVAQKPTAAWDATWRKGFLTPDQFTGLVYRTA